MFRNTHTWPARARVLWRAAILLDVIVVIGFGVGWVINASVGVMYWIVFALFFLAQVLLVSSLVIRTNKPGQQKTRE